MSRTERETKPVGYEYWSKRPFNKHGQSPGKDAESRTQRRTRGRSTRVGLGGVPPKFGCMARGRNQHTQNIKIGLV